MSEGQAVGDLSGAALLELAVDMLLAETPVEIPELVALDRARAILACTERLAAVRLAAIADVDRRELFALDAAGSARGWLRTQPGGENGQLSAARRLEQRSHVQAALAAGQVSARAAEQLCGVLDKVPAQVGDELLRAVLLDGVGGLLQTYTGGLVPDDAVTPDLLADREQAHAVLEACVADMTAGPAQRLEPALVLLGKRLPPSHLGPGLRQLLEALLPDGSDGLDRDPYYFELRELLDGDVDIRGHLTPEVGHGLAAEIARRVEEANAEAKKAATAAGERQPDGAETADSTASVADKGGVPTPEVTDPMAAWDAALDDAMTTGSDPAELDSKARERDPLTAWDEALAAAGQHAATEPAAAPQPSPTHPITAGRRRHDALAQLLNDLSGVQPGSGRPLPPRLSIISTLGALEGRLGTLPAQLATSGQPATLTTAQLQRLACYSDLDAVLLDALGNPVGASHTRRNLTPRERRALRAQWGATCAVAGCPSTVTVPHHVEPYWRSRRTRLRDMIPACEHCHHDLHDGHRTLRLRDGRLINEYGWVSPANAAA